MIVYDRENIIFNKLKSVTIDLKKHIPLVNYRLILKIAKYADEYGIKAFLVGGIVRDLFLKFNNNDIDLTVEGNGIKFGKFLADNLNGAFKSFEKFGTCRIFLENGWQIDIASARKEVYKKPGALPDVKFSSIKDELYRRDFTINSMAICINRSNFGTLIDFFGGRNDIKNKIISVLHNKSFIDDPTRIIRAIRFKARFGFEFNEKTEFLLKNAIKKGVFSTVSAERLRDEFLLLFEEKNFFDALKLAEKYGILNKIYKNLKLHRYFIKYFSKIKNEGLLNKFLLFIFNLNLKQSAELSEKLKLSNEWKNVICEVFENKNKVMKIFKNKKFNKSDVYELFKKLNSKTMDFFNLFCENSGIKSFIKKIKEVKVELKGEDIKKAGIKEGPEIGRILDIIKYKKIAGEIKNKKDEIDFLKNYIKKILL